MLACSAGVGDDLAFGQVNEWSTGVLLWGVVVRQVGERVGRRCLAILMAGEPAVGNE